MRTILFIILLLANTSIVTAQLKIGDALPEVALKNQNNEVVGISQPQGKLLLIDFWASWCAPCRLANKKLVKFHNSLSADKIQIFGISIDTDKSKWIKAIEKDNLKFTQLIDPSGFDAGTAIRFGVEALPAKFLFTEKGILIAINPTEEEIIKYLN
ncbi:TlpA family protein disulfide reductase [Flavobacterium wongokense]|uniref:TlpA family protein disulfide reductase n=1 Tax=Flavobacterium wongokense TaxID=2910674 RepID=UPI001F39C9BC|nr:TlpA disulfide reductase family protein [Flavobacterium sp. WG47]MCF6132764.1 TlpA family protein disulfide reductase [Flavobacterium sp. WG47]